jgi:hypothetical protein
MDLFVNHFLADRDIFQSFGFEALYELGILSASHWQVMQRWSIDKDIDDLEAGILDLDDNDDCGTDVPYDDIHFSVENADLQIHRVQKMNHHIQNHLLQTRTA